MNEKPKTKVQRDRLASDRDDPQKHTHTRAWGGTRRSFWKLPSPSLGGVSAAGVWWWWLLVEWGCVSRSS
ncbi:hypothetical protein Micbo1qcDRAFT_168685, partial [Microdochium bolleyi]